MDAPQAGGGRRGVPDRSAASRALGCLATGLLVIVAVVGLTLEGGGLLLSVAAIAVLVARHEWLLWFVRWPSPVEESWTPPIAWSASAPASMPAGRGDVSPPEAVAESRSREGVPAALGPDAASEHDAEIAALRREADALAYVLRDIGQMSPDTLTRAQDLFGWYGDRLVRCLEQLETLVRGAVSAPPWTPTHLIAPSGPAIRVVIEADRFAWGTDALGRALRVERAELLPLPPAPRPGPAAAVAPQGIQPPVQAPSAPAGPAPWRPPAPPPAPAVPPSPALQPVPTVGEVVMRALRRAGGIVASQIAVDGLAYLGVLLTFTGTLGYVLVAYDSVPNPWLRAGAPLVMPLALAGASVRLRNRGSELMGSVLEFLSAALLPVVLSGGIATVIPSTAGVAVRCAMALALAALYAMVARRRPSSPLRFAVAPMLWVAVWTAALMLHGNAYSPGQVAATAGAVLLTAVAVRALPRLPFAQPTRLASAAGVGVVVVLSLVFAATDRGPAAPLMLTGLMAAATIEVLFGDSRGGRRAVELSLLQTLLVAMTAGVVVPSQGAAAAGLVAVLGCAALLAAQELRRPHVMALPAPLAGLGAGLLLTLGDAWPQMVAAGLVTSAAHTHWLRLWREASAPSLRWSGRAVAAVAMVTGAVFAQAIWQAIPEAQALVILAAMTPVLAVAGAVRARDDALWTWWVVAAALAVVGATAGLRETVDDLPLAGSAALAGFAVALARLWPALRVWSAAAVLTWASVLCFDGAGLATSSRPIAWAAAALAAVVSARVLPGGAAGHLTLAGHVGGVVALGLADGGTTTAATLAAWTAGWAWTVVNAERGTSPLTMLLRRALPPQPGWQRLAVGMPVVLLAGCVPALLLQLLDLTGVVSSHHTWVAVAVGAMALVYAAVVRRTATRQPLAGITATAAVVLSAIAIAESTPDMNTSIATVAGSVAVVGVMGGGARRPFMTWFAWVMGVTLVMLVASRAGVPAGSLYTVMVPTGAGLLLGALGGDRLLGGAAVVPAALHRPWLATPAVLGALVLPTGLALSLLDVPSTYAWWAVGASVVYLAVALLLRTGAVSGIAWGLLAFGVGAVIPVDPIANPDVLAAFSAVLVAAAITASRMWAMRDPWTRWDVAPLVVAHVVAALALARAMAVDSVAVTWALYGGLAVGVAAWRRHWAWAAGGMALLLVAGQAGGNGWFALSLGLASAGTVAAAARNTGFLRTGLQWGGVTAGGAAWVEALLWAARASGEDVAATALASAAAALLLVVLLRRGIIRADWTVSWGALLTAGVAVPAGATPVVAEAARTGYLGTAAALALYAAAATLADTPLRQRWLRWVGALAAGAACVEGLAASEWTAAQWVTAGAAIAAAAAMTVALLARGASLPRAWALPWGAVSAAGMTAAAGVAAAAAVNAAVDVTWTPMIDAATELSVAAALTVWAAACALSMRPLVWSGLAWPCVVALTWAWGELLAGMDLSVGVAIATTAVVAGAVLLGASVGRRMQRLGAAWRLPVAVPALVAVLACGASRWAPAVSSSADARVAALGVAGGLLLLAAAFAVVARVLWPPRLTWATCAAAGWAWGAAMSATTWPVAGAAATTALAAGALGLATGLLTRRHLLTAWWADPLGGLAAGGLAIGTSVVVVASPAGSHHPWGVAAAGGIALFAAAVGMVAEPLRRGGLRSVCAVLAVAALAMVAYDVEPSVEQAVSLAVGTGALSLAAALSLWWWRPGSRWMLPLGEVAALTTVAAIWLAPAAWPARGPLITTTLVTATEATAAGIVMRRPALLYAAPVLACAAWFLFATESLDARPDWLTSAVGVSLLAVVEIARWDRRRGTLPGDPHLADEALLTLDYIGMAFLVGATLVETVVTGPWFGLLGVGVGVAIGCWAVLTRVRHRLEFGAATVLLSLLLLLVAPLTGLAPQLHGFGFWGLLTGVGIALLVIAAVIEQSRGRLVSGLHRFEHMTEGWQ